jgi:hypothetical protein
LIILNAMTVCLCHIPEYTTARQGIDMSDYTISMLAWIALLVAAMPHVNRIRHPDQKPVAAYLIFLFSFLITSAAMYGILDWLTEVTQMTTLIDDVVGTITFLVLVFAPAYLVARWLARKPPWRNHMVPR